MNAVGGVEFGGNSDEGERREPCGCDCERVHDSLCALFDDGDLTAGKADELRRQVAQCPQCFDRLRSEQAVRDLMRRCRCEEPAPATLYERVAAQLRIVRG